MGGKVRMEDRREGNIWQLSGTASPGRRAFSCSPGFVKKVFTWTIAKILRNRK